MRNRFYALFLFSFAAALISCSSKHDINGLYVPYSGPIIYYSLSIHGQGGQYSITLEGVPLRNMQNTPWSLSCTSSLNKNKIVCEDFSLDFSHDFENVTVLYESDRESREQQTFISADKSINEEIVIYDEKGK